MSLFCCSESASSIEGFSNIVLRLDEVDEGSIVDDTVNGLVVVSDGKGLGKGMLDCVGVEEGSRSSSRVLMSADFDNVDTGG